MNVAGLSVWPEPDIAEILIREESPKVLQMVHVFVFAVLVLSMRCR
jgi:hypothetical protein